MTLREVFAANLRMRRAACGLTQEELADAAGIDRSYVSDLECSRYSATLDMIESISAALDIQARELLRPL